MKSISAEKFLESNESTPSQIQISTNLNIIGMESMEKSLSVPFVMTIQYNPSVAQISLKGEVLVKGEKTELEEIQEKHENNENPPQNLVQNIINSSLLEATMISRTLNVPPPLPMPSAQGEGEIEGSENLNYVG